MKSRIRATMAATIRVTTTAMLLTGVLLGSAATASAQDSSGLVDDNEYESPQFDFTLTWDDPWEPAETPITKEGKYDLIVLQSDTALIDAMLLFPTEDRQAYVDALIKNAEDIDRNYDLIDTDEGSDYISATVEFTVELDNGDEQLQRQYIESSDLESREGDDALFSATFTAPASEFDSEWESLNDNIERDGGDPLFRAVPAGLDDSGDEPSDEPTEEPTDEPTDEPSSGIDGDTFLGPNFGLTVEWDDSTWEADDESSDEDDHLVLTADDTQLDIQTITVPDGSARDCVVANADLLEEEGFDDVAHDSEAPAPDLADDAFGRVYGYTDSSGALDVEVLHYFECRPIEGDTFVQIGFKAPADDYEDQLADYEDVADTIEVVGPPEDTNGSDDNGNANGSDDVQEPVLGDDSFTGGVFPFSVSWDADVWTAEEQDFTEDYEAVRLNKDGNTLWIEALGGVDNPDDCLDAALTALENANGFSDFDVDTQLDPPESAKGVSAAIVTNTVTLDSGDEIEALQYVECRELVEGESVLRVTSYMTQDGYEDEVPFLEDVLDTIEIGEPDSNGSGDLEPTEEPDDNGNSSGNDEFEGVDGNEYTGPQYPFSLSWDDSIWEVTEATSGRDVDLLQLTNGTTTFTVTAGPFETEPTDCVGQFAAAAESADGVDDYTVATNDDGEEISDTTANGAWSYFSYDLEGEAYFDYIECVNAPSDYVLAVIVQVPAAELANELAAVQELLASISIK